MVLRLLSNSKGKIKFLFSMIFYNIAHILSQMNCHWYLGCLICSLKFIVGNIKVHFGQFQSMYQCEINGLWKKKKHFESSHFALHLDFMLIPLSQNSFIISSYVKIQKMFKREFSWDRCGYLCTHCIHFFSQSQLT